MSFGTKIFECSESDYLFKCFVNCGMSRILAIDYGRKRTGIAATDDLQLIASAVDTVPSGQLLTWLADYTAKHQVSEVIIGDPIDLKGQPAEVAQLVHQFIVAFKRRFSGIPIVTVDERFTSKMAFQSMIDGGLSKKTRRNKGLVDQIAATILLQSYLEKKK